MLAEIEPALKTLVWQALASTFVGLLFYLKKPRKWIIKPVKFFSVWNKIANMPLNRLEKILFPRLERWQRRRRLKMIAIVALTSLVLAGLVVLVMVLKNSPYK
jgi:hypothetical protein